MTLRVFVIDDSAVVRTTLTGALARAGMQVIGSASDPLFAWPKLQSDWPDVIVLDIEMPRMDGLTFLRKIMAERPTPVVICSSLTEAGAQITLEDLAFEPGTDQLVAEAQAGVARIAAFVAREPARPIRIEGHTDAVGDAAYNLALSDRRAESLALALTEYFQVPPENVVVQGYGEQILRVPV